MDKKKENITIIRYVTCINCLHVSENMSKHKES